MILLRGPLRLLCTCYVMLLRVEWEPLQFVLPEVVIKRLATLSPPLPKPHTSFFWLQMAVFRVMTACQAGGFQRDIVPPLQFLSDVYQYGSSILHQNCGIHVPVSTVSQNGRLIKVLFPVFLVWPLLPSKCSCRVLLLQLITLHYPRTRTLGRTPLYEGLARCRHLYLTIHTNHK